MSAAINSFIFIFNINGVCQWEVEYANGVCQWSLPHASHRPQASQRPAKDQAPARHRPASGRRQAAAHKPATSELNGSSHGLGWTFPTQLAADGRQIATNNLSDARRRHVTIPAHLLDEALLVWGHVRRFLFELGPRLGLEDLSCVASETSTTLTGAAEACKNNGLHVW